MLSNEAVDWGTFVSCSCDLSRTPHHTTRSWELIGVCVYSCAHYILRGFVDPC